MVEGVGAADIMWRHLTVEGEGGAVGTAEVIGEGTGAGIEEVTRDIRRIKVLRVIFFLCWTGIRFDDGDEDGRTNVTRTCT